ncbi:hypothetical protein [Paenibacillus sp. S150]|uniref:hypothetical protein n=1 Tax=Paenibacillus sp. S150 TaxID=2749826 RepID=UPI001C57E2C9|nr:hypothetical protein [Paenibacillus sp. S150]MBW4082215.1 hypothetical protein [Paenibacillus sp. S150]
MRADHLNEQTRGDFNWEHFGGFSYGLGVRTHVSPARSGSLSPLGEFGWSGAAGPVVWPSWTYAQHLLNNQEPYVHRRLRNVIYGCL